MTIALVRWMVGSAAQCTAAIDQPQQHIFKKYGILTIFFALYIQALPHIDLSFCFLTVISSSVKHFEIICVLIVLYK